MLHFLLDNGRAENETLYTLRAICGAVYCNRPCLFVGGYVCV